MPYDNYGGKRGKMKSSGNPHMGGGNGAGYDDMGKGIKYDGHGSDGYDKPQDVAGVEAGLNMRENVAVLDAEMTTGNQRPMGRKEEYMGYTLGTC